MQPPCDATDTEAEKMGAEKWDIGSITMARNSRNAKREWSLLGFAILVILIIGAIPFVL
jgi:hypothetical protein